jgi:heme exporter protein C
MNEYVQPSRPDTMSDITISGGFAAFANPARFMRLSKILVPLFAVPAIALITYGLWLSFTAPADYQQGETVRIMFIHVPFAWLAMMTYSLMTIAALGTLVWRHPLADVAGKAALPTGAVFTALCLITGSLWGRPTWGTYWVWDARLTSVLVLFLIYLGLIAIHRAIDDKGLAARAAAIVTLVGSINIPIIKYSVEWWNTLHQPASISSLKRLANPALPPEYLWPLFTLALGLTLLFFALHLTAMRAEIWSRKADGLSRRMARRAG